MTCDMGRESKCLHEAIDIFSQVGRLCATISTHGLVAYQKSIPTHIFQAVESSAPPGKEEDEDDDDGDIEAQIQRELAGLKPANKKSLPFEGMQLDMPCGMFINPQEHVQMSFRTYDADLR